MKKFVVLTAVAALVFALAPGAQAALLNGSFEAPDMGGGTGANNPDDWTVINDVHGNAIFTEARWDPAGTDDYAGPTDGSQVVVFGDRGGEYQCILKQEIGTVGDLGFGAGANLDFSVRFGSADGDDTGSDHAEDVGTIWRAFWEVNGVRQTANQFASNLGSLAEGRIIPTWDELRAGVDPPPVGPVATSDKNMAQFTVALEAGQLQASDVLTIGFEYDRTANASSSAYNTRVFLDNVTATVPEPATMSLLTLGGLAMLRRRRRS